MYTVNDLFVSRSNHPATEYGINVPVEMEDCRPNPQIGGHHGRFETVHVDTNAGDFNSYSVFRDYYVAAVPNAYVFTSDRQPVITMEMETLHFSSESMKTEIRSFAVTGENRAMVSTTAVGEVKIMLEVRVTFVEASVAKIHVDGTISQKTETACEPVHPQRSDADTLGDDLETISGHHDQPDSVKQSQSCEKDETEETEEHLCEVAGAATAHEQGDVTGRVLP